MNAIPIAGLLFPKKKKQTGRIALAKKNRGSVIDSYTAPVKVRKDIWFCFFQANSVSRFV